MFYFTFHYKRLRASIELFAGYKLDRKKVPNQTLKSKATKWKSNQLYLRKPFEGGNLMAEGMNKLAPYHNHLLFLVSFLKKKKKKINLFSKLLPNNFLYFFSRKKFKTYFIFVLYHSILIPIQTIYIYIYICSIFIGLLYNFGVVVYC